MTNQNDIHKYRQVVEGIFNGAFNSVDGGCKLLNVSKDNFNEHISTLYKNLYQVGLFLSDASEDEIKSNYEMVVNLTYAQMHILYQSRKIDEFIKHLAANKRMFRNYIDWKNSISELERIAANIKEERANLWEEFFSPMTHGDLLSVLHDLPNKKSYISVFKFLDDKKNLSIAGIKAKKFNGGQILYLINRLLKTNSDGKNKTLIIDVIYLYAELISIEIINNLTKMRKEDLNLTQIGMAPPNFKTIKAWLESKNGRFFGDTSPTEREMKRIKSAITLLNKHGYDIVEKG